MSGVVGSNKPIVAWLAVVCIAIVAIIVVGGATRLTNSGLSMVDWQPIMGVVPPMGEQEWVETFEAYKQYPEYQKVNRHMDLGEFKSIFYWEYGHRVLGRSIGMIYLVPFIVFWLQKRLSPSLKGKLLVGFVIGGLQGLMGWYMVKSGLVDMPRVSHYRLAAHLGIAMILLAYLFWIILDLVYSSSSERTQGGGRNGLRRFALVITGVTALQIIYGAFTAGLRAGYGYNTFPLMNEKWIADAVGIMDPFWINLFESNATVQFLHRYIGVLLVILVCVFWVRCLRSGLARAQVLGAHALLALTAVQFLLGVLTLIWVVPISLAVIHQGTAAFVLLGAIYVVYSLGAPAGALQNENAG